MFSALSQGSFIYVLDKTDSPKISTAEVIGVSQPRFNNSQMLVDLKLKIDGNTYDYNNILSNSSLVSYNNGKVIISETKVGLEGEINNMLTHSRDIVSNIEKYKENIVVCEKLLKELNPQYAKDKERDERIESLSTKVLGMESKIDKVLELITKEK